MNEPPSLPIEEQKPSSSLFSRLFNVFAAPGDVFDEVKVSKPLVGNWLVPILLACIVGVLYSCVAFSQEGVIRSIHEAQEKQLQKQVDAGKMSKEQADRALSAMEQFT